MRRLLRQAWRLFGLLPRFAVVLVLRGPTALGRKLHECLSAGAGWRGFFVWVLEQYAFLTRGWKWRYRLWLLRRRILAPRRAVRPDALSALPGGLHLVVLDMTGRGGAARAVAERLVPAFGLAGVEVSVRAPGEPLIEPADGPASPRWTLLVDARGRAVVEELCAMIHQAESMGADGVFGDDDVGYGALRRSPYFKPGFSPELARVQDCVGGVLLVSVRAREALASNTLRVRTGVLSDAALALHGLGMRIFHMPRICFHWESQADRGDLVRQPSSARLPVPGSAGPSATIVVPTRDRLELLKPCIDSVLQHSPDVDFEIMIVDNGSESAETRAWLAEIDAHRCVRVIPCDIPFNWSRLNNVAARDASGDVLVFLNNDTEVISPGWLAALCYQAIRPDVGTVGARLLFPDGTIQHAGVVIGIGGFADHVYSGTPGGAGGHHFVDPELPRNVLANTGACLAVERKVFEDLGGFDERLAICGDIDLCVRAHEAGLQNLYEPEALLWHYESATRSRAPLQVEELEHTFPRIARYLREGDPYYNSNLDHSIRYPSF